MRLTRVLPRQTLEDRPMLGINRKELPRRGKRHEQVSTNNQGFLVGESQPSIARKDGMTRLETGGPDNRDEDDIAGIHARKLNSRVRTAHQLAALGKLLKHWVIGMGLVGHADVGDFELTRIPNEV